MSIYVLPTGDSDLALYLRKLINDRAAPSGQRFYVVRLADDAEYRRLRALLKFAAGRRRWNRNVRLFDLRALTLDPPPPLPPLTHLWLAVDLDEEEVRRRVPDPVFVRL